jgi:hypothetical protein
MGKHAARGVFGSKRRRNIVIFLAVIIVYACIQTFFNDQGDWRQNLKRWKNEAMQHPFMTYVFTFFFARSAASYKKAEAYYNSERPHLLEAARNFHLHKYFTHTEVTSIDMGWFDLIGARLKAMGDLLKAEGKDDFKIEKDKCEMTRFFILNKFPICPVLKWYDEKDTFKKELAGGTAFDTVEHWPIFIKNCHLTQGSAKGTKRLSGDKAKMGWIPGWVDEKWWALFTRRSFIHVVYRSFFLPAFAGYTAPMITSVLGASTLTL